MAGSDSDTPWYMDKDLWESIFGIGSAIMNRGKGGKWEQKPRDPREDQVLNTGMGFVNNSPTRDLIGNMAMGGLGQLGTPTYNVGQTIDIPQIASRLGGTGANPFGIQFPKMGGVTPYENKGASNPTAGFDWQKAFESYLHPKTSLVPGKGTGTGTTPSPPGGGAAGSGSSSKPIPTRDPVADQPWSDDYHNNPYNPRGGGGTHDPMGWWDDQTDPNYNPWNDPNHEAPSPKFTMNEDGSWIMDWGGHSVPMTADEVKNFGTVDFKAVMGGVREAGSKAWNVVKENLPTIAKLTAAAIAGNPAPLVAFAASKGIPWLWDLIRGNTNTDQAPPSNAPPIGGVPGPNSNPGA